MVGFRGPTATRPSLVRLQRILGPLRRNEYPNARKLADEFECSPRTVQRDIDLLRDQLGYPIAFDSRKNGYYLTGPAPDLPATKMTAADLAAFLVAERALAASGPGPLAKVLRGARAKLQAALPESVRLQPEDQLALVTFRAMASLAVRDEVFAALARAVAERRRLRVDYRSATRGGARSSRQIDPYALVAQDGVLYALAHCHTRRAVLTFAAGRIDRVEETGERFVRPPDFTPGSVLDGAFRLFRGGRAVTVRVWFSPQVAVYLKERKWHPSQQLQERLDGSVEAKFKVTYPDELLRWVLGWGPVAEVLGPPSVRRRAAEMLREALGAYEGPGSLKVSSGSLTRNGRA